MNVLDGEHGDEMLPLLEAIQWSTADALGGGVWGDQFWVLGF